jgi:hypothetical protein
MMGKFKDRWKEYKGLVIHPDAGPVQKEETRRAFYAGALAVFDIADQHAREKGEKHPGDTLTQDDINVGTEIRKELIEFLEHIRVENALNNHYRPQSRFKN